MGEIHKLTKDGVTLFPATTTDAVAHPQVRTSLSNLISEFNVSNLYPTGGSDNSDRYTLQGAISILGAKLTDAQKIGGVKVVFIDSTGEIQRWRFLGDSFMTTGNWAREDSWYVETSEDVENLEDNLLNDSLRKTEQSLTSAEKNRVKTNLDLELTAKKILWSADKNLNSYNTESCIYSISGYRVNPNDNMPLINAGAEISISGILMVQVTPDVIGQNITITEAGTGETKTYSRTYKVASDTWTTWTEDRQIMYVGEISALELDLLCDSGCYCGKIKDFSILNTDITDLTPYAGSIEFYLMTIGDSSRCTQLLYPLSTSTEANVILTRIGTGSVFYPFTQLITKTVLTEILGSGVNTSTAITNLQNEVDFLKSEIEVLKLKESSDYCVAAWDPNVLTATSIETYGNLDFCGKWDAFLFDTTQNTEPTMKPVGKLMRNNFLRFEDGTFAPTVGITEERRAECDVDLYTKSGSTLTKLYDAGTFNAADFYNTYGMSTKLYDSTGKEVNILRPWETTETKYTIGVGRENTIYLLDNIIGKSGKAWKGIFSKPITWDGIDVSQYELKPTAISPGPCAVINDNGVDKARCFFYLYEGQSSCGGNKGLVDCTIFKGDRTWPVSYDNDNASGLRCNQIKAMEWARNNNADTQSPMPIAEGGFHAWNAYITSYEVLHGTKYLHSNSKFTGGICADTCNSESTWKANGGIRFKEPSATSWMYGLWNTYLNNKGYYRKSDLSDTDNYLSNAVNYCSPKEQCMESQMVASYAKELGIAENTEFEFYGSTYWYKNVPGAIGLESGEMNVVVYKKVTGTMAGLYNSSAQAVTLDTEIIIKVGLVNGVNLGGDVINYTGGGIEFVGTCDKPKTPEVENYVKTFPFDIYFEPNQENWLYETFYSKSNLGRFEFEDKYRKLGSTVMSLPGDGYTKKRVPYTTFQTERGGSVSTGECAFCWTGNSWSTVLNTRVRVGLQLRSLANHISYGFRSALMYDPVYRSSYHSSVCAQIRMPEALPLQA